MRALAAKVLAREIRELVRERTKDRRSLLPRLAVDVLAVATPPGNDRRRTEVSGWVVLEGLQSVRGGLDELTGALNR